MKKSFLFLFFFIWSLSSISQYNPTPHTIDSLTQLLSNTKDDSTKYELFYQLGLANASVNVNKSTQHFNDALETAKQLKDKERMMNVLIALSFTYSGIGESAKAIEMLQQVLRYKEETKSDPSMALAFISQNYEAQGDYTNAISYARKSFFTYEQGVKDKTLPFDPVGDIAGPMKMGIIFEKMNLLDSAFYYGQMSYQRVLKSTEPYFFCQICNLLGTINSRLNKPDEALHFYHLALAKAIEVNFPVPLQESQLAIANFYKTNKPDSAIQYALQAYEGAEKLKGFNTMRDAALLLRTVYKKQGAYAKALFYNDLSVAARDSVTGADKIREVQNLTFKEERRQDKIQQELAADKVAYQTKIKIYSLLAFLGVALLLAFILYRNNQQQKKANKIIFEEKRRSDELLLNILPAETAEELKATGTAKAKGFEEVTVLFTDFKNFTLMSEQLSAQELVNEINYCYSAFDNIITKYGIEKIKTIGDSYMCAGGLPVENTTNAEDAIKAAIEIRDFMLAEKQKREVEGKIFFEIRIGLHTGPVVAGIVGIKKFAYDIWGDTVNIASRMESSGGEGKVNISGVTYKFVKDKFDCTYRGKIQAKNKGEIDMYFVEDLN